MFSNYKHKSSLIILLILISIPIIQSCQKEDVIIVEQRHNLILYNKYNYDLTDTLIANIRFWNDDNTYYLRNIMFVQAETDTFLLAEEIVTTIEYNRIDIDLIDYSLAAKIIDIPKYVDYTNKNLLFYITKGNSIFENLNVSQSSDTSATVEFDIFDEGYSDLLRTEILITKIDTISHTYVDSAIFYVNKIDTNSYISYITNLTPNNNYKAKITALYENSQYNTYSYFDISTFLD